jgi:hypothetical protein
MSRHVVVSTAQLHQRFTRLTLLSSEERVGALIVLVVLLQTARGQEILLDRFSLEFDQRRRTRAAQFLGHQNNEDEEGGEPDNEIDEEDGIEQVDEDVDASSSATSGRTSLFVPTPRDIQHVSKEICRHDLSFLFEDIFPFLPQLHILECLKAAWKMTCRLHDTHAVALPPWLLDTPQFRPRPPDAGVPLLLAGPQLAEIFGVDVPGLQSLTTEMISLPAARISSPCVVSSTVGVNTAPQPHPGKMTVLSTKKQSKNAQKQLPNHSRTLSTEAKEQMDGRHQSF